MMVFDALTYNTDRHLGNFGLMVNNKTNKPYAFAPIFDNGLALFPAAMPDDFANLETYAKSRTPVFGASFDELAAAFITDRQRKQLHKLIDFHYMHDKNYNLSAWKIKKMESFIRERSRIITF